MATTNTINGTRNDDVLVGTAGNDLIRGLTGGDSVDGIDGDDYLDGGPGNDILIGGEGDDWLIGNAGNDVLDGGTGADQFRFSALQITGAGTATPGHDVDRIVDLDFAEGDVIVLADFDPDTFRGTDINGSLDLIDTGRGPGSGTNIRDWAGLIDLIEASPLVTAARDGTGDTLLLSIATASGTSQTIAIANGWTPYLQLTNRAPDAGNDTAAVNEDATVTGNVLTNDTDADAGDRVSVTSAGKPGAAQVPAGGAITGTYGVLTLAVDGSYGFAATTPAAQALRAGQVVTETFRYTVTDEAGATDTADLAITITGTNDAPVARALSGTTTVGAAPIGFTADFTDVDLGDTHAITIGTMGTRGAVTLAADGSFRYAAGSGFAGLAAGAQATDSFTYTVTDAAGAASTQTVTVTVTGIATNAPPVVVSDSNGLCINTKLAVGASRGVLANDRDSDGDAIAVVAVGGSAGGVGAAITGAYGTLVLKADGSYTYTANGNAARLPDRQLAQDSFSYTVSDGKGGTATTTLTISVADRNEQYKRGDDGCDLLLNILGKSVLDGGNGDDWLTGGFSTDYLVGGGGDDKLIGGFGNDTFVFNAGHGNDTIYDFGLGRDSIQVSKAIFANFAELKGAARVEGNAIVIDTGDGSSISLFGYRSVDRLDAADFLFT